MFVKIAKKFIFRTQHYLIEDSVRLIL